jgi:O-antigen ligase
MRSGAAAAGLHAVALRSGDTVYWLGALLAAGALGAAGASRSALYVSVAAAAGAMAVLVLAYRWPARALTAALFLLPLTATKFRRRSAAASLSGEVDAQVLFELSLYALLALIAVAAVARTGIRGWRVTRREALLGTYAIIVVSSTAWSAVPTLTAVRGLQICILMLTGMIAMRVLGPGRLVGTLAAAAIPYVLVCSTLALLFPWAAGQAAAHRGIERFTWFAVHPITAASFASVAALWVFMRMQALWRTAPTHAWCLGLLIVPLLIILGLTRSRGPALALVAAAGFLLVRTHAPRWMIAVFTAGAIAMATLATAGSPVSVLSQQTADAAPVRFLLRGQTVEEVVDFSGRAALWEDVRGLVSSQPLFGYGHGAARGLLLDTYAWAGHAHNALLQSVLDVGILGALPLWIAIVGAFITIASGRRWRAARLELTDTAALAYLTFFLVSGITETVFAGAPGYDLLLVASAALAVQRIGRARTVPSE